MTCKSLESASQYFDCLMHQKQDKFKESLAKDIVVHYTALNGNIQGPVKTIKGVQFVFLAFKNNIFDRNSNYDIKQLSFECTPLAVDCKYLVENDKKTDYDIERIQVKGHTKLVFVRDPSTQDLKIKEIWETTDTTLIKS